MTTSLSFAGASQLAKALGPTPRRVRRHHGADAPLAGSSPWCANAAKPGPARAQEAMSVTALEACIAAKVLVEA
jgi:hypothetical protein